MGIRTLTVIATELLLLGVVLRYRSPWLVRLLLVMSLADVIVLIPDWPWMSETTYNHIWMCLTPATYAVEGLLMIVTIYRMTDWDALNVSVIVAMVLHLRVALESYWVWDVVSQADGYRMLHLAQWLGAFVIALLALLIYRDGTRNPRKEQ